MKSKNLFVMFLALVLVFAMIPFVTFASEAEPIGIEPRVAVSISKTTSVDSLPEIAAEEVFDVTVRFRSILASNGEQFTITATDGAKILINNPSDVTVMMGGVPGNIHNITNTGGNVGFITSTPATTPAENVITFQVKAPSASGEFTISTKIGLDSTANSSSNFIEKTFTVAAAFYIDTTLDIVAGNETFDIFGEIGVLNPFGDYSVGFSVKHKITNNPILADFKPANNDGSYSFTNLTFPNNAEEGTYIVEAVLLDAEFEIIGTVQKEIEYKRPPFEVNTSIDVIMDGTPFDVFGEIGFENVDGEYQVGLAVNNKVTNDSVLIDFIPANADGSYSFEGLVFPITAEEGIYVVEAVLLDAGFNIVAIAQKEVEYKKSPPVVDVPDKIVLDSTLGGVSYITGYPAPFKNIYRAGANSNVTISGTATKNGVPIANAEITIGIKHWSWENWTASNFHKTLTVATDSDGKFSGVIRTAAGHALDRPTTHYVYNGVSTHILEEATIYAQSADGSNVKAERNIYILAGTK